MFLGMFYVIETFLPGTPRSLDVFMTDNMALLLIISGVLTLLFSFLIPFARGHNPFKYLDFRRISLRDTAMLALTGIGFSFFLNSLMTMIQIEEIIPDPISDPLTDLMMSNFALVFLAVGILAPLYEEVLFRGLILKEMKANINIWLALLLQGLIFGLFHGNLLQFTYTFPAGILLGAAFLRYRSMWAPILIHLAWNSTSTIMSNLLPEASYLTFGLFLFAGAAFMVIGAVYSWKFTSPAPAPVLLDTAEEQGAQL